MAVIQFASVKGLIIAFVMIVAQPLVAKELNIPNVPLYSHARSEANVLMMVDDSGSMDFEVLTDAHWMACNYTPGAKNCKTTKFDDGAFYAAPITYQDEGIIAESKKFEYIWNDIRHILYQAVAENYQEYITNDFRIFDSGLNHLYYNPDIEYLPWKGPCSGDGTELDPYKMCQEASIQAVRLHPHSSHRDHVSMIDLTTQIDGKLKYMVSIDDKGFDGNKPEYNNITEGPNGIVDLWDSHVAVIFTSLDNISIIAYETNVQDLETQEIFSQTLSGNACYDVLGDKVAIQEMFTGKRSFLSTDGPQCRTIAQAQQNLANWFQYYRNRDLTARAAVGHVIHEFPNLRYGLAYINDTNNIAMELPLQGGDYYSHNQALLNHYFSYELTFKFTPLVSALDTAGKYFKGDLYQSPITTPCAYNYTILLTDGYWNGAQPSLGDVDGDGYGGSASTLSDVARYYYINDLSPLPNIVPITNDNAYSHQSMRTIGISFGAKGKLQRGPDGWPFPELGINSDWGDPNCSFFKACPEKIDDLWHAAFNSNGAFYSANNIKQLHDGLKSALSMIALPLENIGSGTTATSSMLLSDTLVFYALYDSYPWAGDLHAYPINLSGHMNVNNTRWSAANQLDQLSPSNRVIYTYNGSQGVLFEWPLNYLNPKSTEISSAQTRYLLRDIEHDHDASGQAKIAYLRGERSGETKHGGVFRDRATILGDIIHSAPLVIEPPNAIYNDEAYIQFKQTYSNRMPLLAVGANDGMLHVFNAKSGQEQFAYVPGMSSIYHGLAELTRPDYQHRYFVDGQLSSSDVYLSKDFSWHTVLLGSLRAGGQGIFALDITKGAFSNTHSDSQNTVMWEFTDEDDPDMGYIFGEIQIVKMANNRWAAVFGNGYNSTASQHIGGGPDMHSATNGGQACLFIVFLDGPTNGKWQLGVDYIKISLGDGNANGLSQPFPVDTTFDYKVNYIYAGDLNGELWKVDVSNPNPSFWLASSNISKIYSTTQTAGSGWQPIVQAPVVGPHPQGLDKGLMIYFGTGKYIETTDNASSGAHTQALYAIWDKNNSLSDHFVGTDLLQKQTIVFSGNQLRAVSNNTVDWTTQRGWYLPLEEYLPVGDGYLSAWQNQAERISSTPILRNGRVIFTTLIPASNQNCNAQFGTSWLMELDAKHGGRLAISPIDINKDKNFNQLDNVMCTINGEDVSIPSAGIKSDVGFVNGRPTILSTPKNDYEIKILSGSSGVQSIREHPGEHAKGRQSWQTLN